MYSELSFNLKNKYLKNLMKYFTYQLYHSFL